MMIKGRIEEYYWYDLDEMDLRDLVVLIRPQVMGLQAVNTSWDSGVFTPAQELVQQGWTVHGRAGVTPPVTESLIQAWPASQDDYCDEWWFFRMVPADFDFTHGFCNMIGMRIADWRQLEFEGGVQLARNLCRFSPEIVIGNNQWTYCVTRKPLTALNAQQLHQPEAG